MHSKKVIEEYILQSNYFPSGRGVLFILFPRVYSQIIKYKVKNFYISRSTTYDDLLKIVCYRRYSLANTIVVYISILPYVIPAVPHLSSHCSTQAQI